MSNKLIDASLKLKGMSSTCKLVLLVLANSARDDKGGSCWPSISVIAESCCLSDRAVRNALKWLVKSGAITSKRQFNSSSIYTVTPEHYSIVELNSPPEQCAYTTECGSTTERRSPPEQYSPPEQCAAPPCTTFTPPLNNVPNKLNLNVTETELKKEKSAREVFENPPPEPEPAYAKTDIQQPHTDNRTMFEMSLDWKPTANINGVGEDFFRVKGYTLAQGQAFDADSVRRQTQEAVIDPATKKALFPEGENPIGQVIFLGAVPVRIIGVTSPQESAFAMSDNLNVWVPYTTAMRRMMGVMKDGEMVVLNRDGGKS